MTNRKPPTLILFVCLCVLFVFGCSRREGSCRLPVPQVKLDASKLELEEGCTIIAEDWLVMTSVDGVVFLEEASAEENEPEEFSLSCGEYNCDEDGKILFWFPGRAPQRLSTTDCEFGDSGSSEAIVVWEPVPLGSIECGNRDHVGVATPL